MLETIFHGETCVQVCKDDASMYIDPFDTDIHTSSTHGYTVLHPTCGGTLVHMGDAYIYHLTSNTLHPDLKDLHEQYTIDITFLALGDDSALSLEDAVTAASYLHSRFIVPMHTGSSPKALEEMIEFARCVLLENYAVPKVLRVGQAIVLQ